MLGTMRFAYDAAAVHMAIAFVAATDVRGRAACIVPAHGIARGCTVMR